MHHQLLIGLLLPLAGMIAGMIDTIAGGGGLISLPALLATGLPPLHALGTNRFQACFGEFSASFHFWRRRQIKLKQLSVGFLCTAVGASLGTLTVEWLDPAVLQKIIPLLLIAVFIYTLFAPKPQTRTSPSRFALRYILIATGLTIGFYNGFFGPPTGSFWIVALMALAHFDIKHASMNAKPLNCMGNIISVLVFSLNGNVNVLYGVYMICGQLVGTWIGSHLVMTRGNKLIRPLFLLTVAIMIIDLIYKALTHA